MGGTVRLEADTITLGDKSTITATGTHGGGTVLVGGEWQGGGTMTRATTVTMEAGATIDASATEAGDGGTIVLWSDVLNVDSITRAYGSLIARGGALFGDGGQIETSGNTIDIAGVQVDAGISQEAYGSAVGKWLIDPFNYVINSAAATAISAALNTNDVTVTTTADNASLGSTGAGNGNIILDADILKTGSVESTLTLQAHRRVDMSTHSIGTTDGALNVVLWSDFDNTNDGGVSRLGNLTTGGGHVWAGGSRTAEGSDTWNGLSVGDGPSVGSNGSNFNAIDISGVIDTAGGDVLLWAGSAISDGIASNSAASIDAGDGNIELRANSFVNDGTALAISTTGNLVIESDGTSFTSPLGAGTFDLDNSTFQSVRIGKADNTANITLDGNLTVAGGVAIHGGDLLISAALTSTDTGDIYIQSNSATNNSVVVSGSILKTGGDRSTLTLRGDGRVNFYGNITGSGSTALDTVLWSDYHNTNVAGSTVASDIDTNGGHLWVGGSSSDGGHSTWNGLTVGDGASIGAAGANQNALDLTGNLTTSGGDVLLWGGAGASLISDGIWIHAARTINAGSGDVTLIANRVSGEFLTVDSTGHLTIKPHDNAFNDTGGQLDFIGNIASNTFTGAGDVEWLKINNYTELGGLTIGKEGMTTAIRTYNPVDISGPINLIGGSVIVGDDLKTSRADNAGHVLLKALADIQVEPNATIETNGANITLWGDSDASGQGYISVGQNATLDSRTAADRTANTHTNGGGKITLAGGADDGSGGPSGFATAGSSDAGHSGVSLGDDITGVVNNIQILSGGGDVTIKGQAEADMMGVLWVDGGSLNAGSTGLVRIEGVHLGNGHGVELGGYTSNSRPTIRSGGGSDGNPAIEVIGTTAATTEHLGILLNRLTAIAEGDGGINFTGTTTGGGTGYGIHLPLVELLSASGDINVDGGILGVRTFGLELGRKAGTPITTSTANVTLTGDRFFSELADTIATSGVVTIEPDSTSFSGALNYPLNLLTLSSDVSGLTLGKAGNTAAMNINQAVNISGAIQIHGGDVALNSNLTSTATTGTGVSIVGTKISQFSGVDVQTSGADIDYLINAAVATAGPDRALDVRGDGVNLATIDAGGGDINLNAAFAAGGLADNSDRAISLQLADVKTSGDGSIHITGDASENMTTGSAWGIHLLDSVIRTADGDMQLIGTGGRASGNSRGIAIDRTDGQFLSESGTITFRDITPTNLTGNHTGFYLRPDANEIIIGADGSTVATSTSDVIIQSDRVTFDDNSGLGTTINTTGSVTIEPIATSFAADAKLQHLDLSGTSKQSLTIGRSGNTATVLLGSDVTTTGTQTFHGPLQLIDNVSLSTTNANIDFKSTVNSNGSARNLTINAGTANVLFGGEVGGTLAINDLNVTGAATIPGNVTTSGSQTWASGLTITGDSVLTGSALSMQAVTAADHDLSLVTDALTLGGNVTGTGDLAIATKTSGATIGVGTATGTLTVSNAALAKIQDGFASITIGNTLTGALVVGGINTLTDDLTLRAGTGADLSVDEPITWTSDNSLTLAAGDNIFVGHDIVVGGENATLNLLYGGTDGTTAPTAGTNFVIDIAGRRTIDFDHTSANLKLGNQTHTLIDNKTDLQAMTATGHYALAGELDLAGDTHNEAFYTTTFAGGLDGLGHVIDNLTISNTDGGNLGLFAELNGATVRHLGVTNFNIRTNSSAATHEYRVGGLVGNVGGAGTPVTSVTTLDGVWTTGVISTKQDSKQKFFFGGGLVGSQNGGFLNLSRSYSTANVSTSGSYSSNLALGGLVGDIGINVNLLENTHTTTDSSVVDFDIRQSYAIGSIVQGTKGAYFGSGGLVGVIFTDGGSLTESYSWGNVVGTGSFGGIAGFALNGTYANLYTTEASVGSGSVATSSTYNGTTLPGATNNGATLPAGWLADIWSAGERPTLRFLPTPPKAIYVQVTDGGTSIYGDAVAPTYTLVDADGAAVVFGIGDYVNLTGVSGTGLYTLDAQSRADDHQISYLNGLGLIGADAADFILNPSSDSGAYEITARQLTVTLSNSDVTKEYDRTTAGPSGFSPTFTIGNFAGGDTAAALSHTTVAFNDQDVADADTLTVSGLGLTSVTGTRGSVLSDYSLPGMSVDVAASITAKAVTVSGVTASNKVYDGLDGATIDSDSASLSGVIAGDTVSIASASGTFADKNVGTGKSVSLSMTFAGAQASNYSISSQSTATADITAKAITVSGITAANREYDTTTAAKVDATGIQFTGIVGGDSLQVASSTGTFGDKNVGTDKTVTLSTTYSGDDLANYDINDQASTTADITAKALTVSGITAADKQYDAGTSATTNHASASLNGLFGGDDLTIATTTGTFGDKNAGEDKNVTISTTYAGADIGNYDITDQATTTATISQKTLTVSGITAADKTYDGNDTAAIDATSVLLNGLIGGDALEVDNLSGTFGDKNAATGKTVTLSTTYTGADVDNYAITDQSNTTADITAKSITVSGITAASREYDTTTSATVDATGIEFTGIVDGDTLQVASSTGTFGDKNVGSGKTVTLSTAYSGDDLGNYDITDQVTTTANITAKTLTVSGITAADKDYDALTSASTDHSNAVLDGSVRWRRPAN